MPLLKRKVITALALLLFPAFAFGQGITLTPLKYNYEVERGEVVEDTITVKNASRETGLTVLMQKEHMEAQGETGHVVFRELGADEETAKVLSLPNWIEFEEDEFFLEAMESRDLPFTITVPENATPGGHYAGIIAANPASQVDGTGVGITSRIAANMLVSVAGEVVEDLSILEFKTLKSYYERGPVKFLARFENRGTVHLSPEAKITVYDIRGREVANLEVEEKTVLPNSIRGIETEWDTDLLWSGKYKAVLSGVYGEDGDLGDMEVTFYAFPWKYALAGFLVLIFFILTRRRWVTIIKILVKGEAALKEKEE